MRPRRRSVVLHGGQPNSASLSLVRHVAAPACRSAFPSRPPPPPRPRRPLSSCSPLFCVPRQVVGAAGFARTSAAQNTCRSKTWPCFLPRRHPDERPSVLASRSSAAPVPASATPRSARRGRTPSGAAGNRHDRRPRPLASTAGRCAQLHDGPRPWRRPVGGTLLCVHPQHVSSALATKRVARLLPVLASDLCVCNALRSGSRRSRRRRRAGARSPKKRLARTAVARARAARLVRTGAVGVTAPRRQTCAGP